MPNYTVLKTKLTEFVSGETRLEIAANLNAKTIPAFKPIPAILLQRYLFLKDLKYGIKKGTSKPLEVVIDAFNTFDEFDLTNPIISEKFTATLDELVADVSIPEFTITNKSEILLMANDMVSWANLNWDGHVTIPDIETAEVL